MKGFFFVVLLLIGAVQLQAQDPSQKPDKKTVQRMLDWVSIFTMYSDVELSDKVDLSTYGEAADVVGAMVTNNELSVKIAEFKAATFVNIYPKGLTNGEEWIFKKLNDVSNAQYDVLNAPYITLDVLFTSVNQNTGYQVSVTLKGSSQITQNLSTATSTINSALAGKTFAKPRDAKEAVNQAIFSGLNQLKTTLGSAFVPNILVQFGDDRYQNGNTIETWQRAGEKIELEAIDKDGVPLTGTITWTNAQGTGSRATYPIDVAGTNIVTVKAGANQMNLNVKVKEFEFDVKALIKKILIEILTEKKKQAIEDLAKLRADSTANANSIATLIAKLEGDNFPMENDGNSASPMFNEPIKLTDSTEFMKGEDRVNGFKALRNRKRIVSSILSKLDVVAFAELVVEKPDQLKTLADELVNNSGELIAQLILNQRGKEEEGGRNIVMDYLNKNMQRLAGTGSVKIETNDIVLPVASTTSSASKKFDPATYLYISSQVQFKGRDQFIKQLTDSLSKLKNLYVFINYSQDVSTETYLKRNQNVRPKGLPENVRYISFSFVNIPGSVKEQLFVGSSDLAQSTIQPQSSEQGLWESIQDAAAEMAVRDYFAAPLTIYYSGDPFLVSMKRKGLTSIILEIEYKGQASIKSESSLGILDRKQEIEIFKTNSYAQSEYYEINKDHIGYRIISNLKERKELFGHSASESKVGNTNYRKHEFILFPGISTSITLIDPKTPFSDKVVINDVELQMNSSITSLLPGQISDVVLASGSTVIPAGTILYVHKDCHLLVSAAETRAALGLRHSGFYITYSPPLVVKVKQGDFLNIEWISTTYNFKTHELKHTLKDNVDLFDYVESEVISGLDDYFRVAFKNTLIGNHEYDPFKDQNVQFSLDQVKRNLDEDSKINHYEECTPTTMSIEELKDPILSSTFYFAANQSYLDEDGTGIVLKSGIPVTISFAFDGAMGKIIELEQIRIKNVTLNSNEAIVLKYKNRELANLKNIVILPGGKVLVNDTRLVGELDVVQRLEQGVLARIAALIIYKHTGRLPVINPTSQQSLTGAAVEVALELGMRLALIDQIKANSKILVEVLGTRVLEDKAQNLNLMTIMGIKE